MLQRSKRKISSTRHASKTTSKSNRFHIPLICWQHRQKSTFCVKFRINFLFFKQFCFCFSWFLHFIVLFAVKRSNTIKRVAYIKILTIFIVVLGATESNIKIFKQRRKWKYAHQSIFLIKQSNLQGSHFFKSSHKLIYARRNFHKILSMQAIVEPNFNVTNVSMNPFVFNQMLELKTQLMQLFRKLFS